MSKIDPKLWEETSASGDFLRIEVGPYLARIVKIEDVEAKEYVKVYVDLTQGKYKDIFKQQADRFEGDWPIQGISYRSYKTKAYSFLKAFVTALEKSNAGYNFAATGFDFNSFVGKQVVAVYGIEEYENTDHEIVESIKIQEFRSIQALQEGKIETPKPKLVSEERKKQLAFHNAKMEERTEIKEDPFRTQTALVQEEDLPF